MIEYEYPAGNYLREAEVHEDRLRALTEGKDYQKGDIVFWKALGKALTAYKVLDILTLPKGLALVLEGVEGPEDAYTGSGPKTHQTVLKKDLDQLSQGQALDISKRLVHLGSEFFGEQKSNSRPLTEHSKPEEKHIHESTLDALYGEFNRSIEAFYLRGDFQALYNTLSEMYEHQRLRIQYSNDIKFPEIFGEEDFHDQLKSINSRVKSVLAERGEGRVPQTSLLINSRKLSIITEITTLMQILKNLDLTLQEAN